MFNFLKKLFGFKEKSQYKDHCGMDIAPDEKSVSSRLKQTEGSRHSVIRRVPIDMSQGD